MQLLFQIIGFLTTALTFFYFVFRIFRNDILENVQLYFGNVPSDAAFYGNAYGHLISTHVGLFTALIAVAVAVLGFQKWFDYKEVEKLKEELPGKIDSIVNDRKPGVVKDISLEVNKKIAAEVEKKTRDFFCSMVETTLKFLTKEQKKGFCVEMIKSIWSARIQKDSDDVLDSMLKYHLTLTKLLKELNSLTSEEKTSLHEDSLFEKILVSIKGRLNEIETSNKIAYKYQLGGFAELVNSF